jgi:hypothetical protein
MSEAKETTPSNDVVVALLRKEAKAMLQSVSDAMRSKLDEKTTTKDRVKAFATVAAGRAILKIIDTVVDDYEDQLRAANRAREVMQEYRAYEEEVRLHFGSFAKPAERPNFGGRDYSQPGPGWVQCRIYPALKTCKAGVNDTAALRCRYYVMTAASSITVRTAEEDRIHERLLLDHTTNEALDAYCTDLMQKIDALSKKS